ncbi:MAG: protein translocase subunit SecF, partial [Deltaproteobacteria bacterium]|nr:protein translocase subunit SecF [Deltaproteobacteria bacterium]
MKKGTAVELIKHDTHIDFVGKIKGAGILSGVLVLASIVVLIANGGPRYGIDFVGGSLLQVRFTSGVSGDQVREAIAPAVGRDASVQPFGDEHGNEFLINIPSSETGKGIESLTARITEQFTAAFGAEGFEVRRTEMVGPKVGKELRQKGMLAVFWSLLGMLAYIWFRFELRF